MATPMRGAYRPTDQQHWEREAACGTHPMPELWDGIRDGETVEVRHMRHVAAATVCLRRCPVRDECAKSRVPFSGVKAGKWRGHPINIGATRLGGAA